MVRGSQGGRKGERPESEEIARGHLQGEWERLFVSLCICSSWLMTYRTKSTIRREVNGGIARQRRTLPSSTSLRLSSAPSHRPFSVPSQLPRISSYTMRPTAPSWLKVLVPIKRTVDYAVKIRVGANGVETAGVKHSLVSSSPIFCTPPPALQHALQMHSSTLST